MPVKTLIAGDDVQRTAIAHLQLIAARVRRVEQAQAHPATGHFDIRALRAVNQQRIANEATAPRFAVFRRTEIIQTFVPMIIGKSSTP